MKNDEKKVVVYLYKISFRRVLSSRSKFDGHGLVQLKIRVWTELIRVLLMFDVSPSFRQASNFRLVFSLIAGGFMNAFPFARIRAR